MRLIFIASSTFFFPTHDDNDMLCSQVGPQGAFCDNDISGGSEEKEGGDIVESIFPSMSCVDIAGDIANDIVPPATNDASGDR